MAGYSSDNKYSLLGGLRAAGQLIAYELPLVLATLGVVIQAGSMNLHLIDTLLHRVLLFGTRRGTGGTIPAYPWPDPTDPHRFTSIRADCERVVHEEQRAAVQVGDLHRGDHAADDLADEHAQSSSEACQTAVGWRRRGPLSRRRRPAEDPG